MNPSVNDIPTINLILVFIPAIPVFIILYYWQLGVTKSITAMARMLLQLIAIGYVLAFLFETQQVLFILSVLAVMICAATWISLNPLTHKSAQFYVAPFFAIVVGGGLTLAIVTQGVLAIEPWYAPRQMIPLAGMIFANVMTAISLSAERLFSELKQGTPYQQARATAFNASLIPTINALLAVGLVSLPGMMTGQILAGTPPNIAVKYQIVVMVMIFSSAGLSTALFLAILKKMKIDRRFADAVSD